MGNSSSGWKACVFGRVVAEQLFFSPERIGLGDRSPEEGRLAVSQGDRHPIAGGVAEDAVTGRWIRSAPC